MKKIVYASITKLIAVILTVACLVLGALAVVEGFLDYNREEMDIYSFESDFSESWYLSYLLSIPESAVYDAYYRNSNVTESDEAQTEADTDGEMPETEAETEPIPSEDATTAPSRETVAANLKRLFDRVIYESDRINYYVQWNEKTFTNCGAESAEPVLQGEYHTYLTYMERDGVGHVERSSTVETRAYLLEDLDAVTTDNNTIVIACSLKDEVAREYKAIWEYQEKIVIHTCMRVAVCAVVALLLLVYLLCVCGKNAKGEYQNMWVDHLWLEVHLAAMTGAVIGAVALCILVLEEYFSGHFPLFLLRWAVGGGVALGGLILITSLLSIVRNIKTRTLMESSVIFLVLRWSLGLLIRILRWIGRAIKAFGRGIGHLLAHRTGVMFMSMLFVYTALIGAVGIAAAFGSAWIVAGILLFLLACFVVGWRARDLTEVQKGVSEVKNGNVSYQIPELKCEDLRTLAANINGIAQGLDDAVSAKVKAERHKTELITNVSHDLKTPITSIISYTELLSQIEDLPEEARDYVAVIAKKSARLKRLTQDLFDISKAQSGNEEVIWERLDVALLINQALGELDNEIRESGLTFCVDAPKELYVSADGHKMSRVLGNLIHNALKYAMAGTRVFVTAAERDGRVELVLKNVSAYPLNFSGEEITGRFVRGDEARTADGNGLGLAIAKSYTELCNGTFEIQVDGDLFKAILTLPRHT